MFGELQKDGELGGTITVTTNVTGASIKVVSNGSVVAEVTNTATSTAIKGIKAGTYTVEVSKDGYVTATKEVTVNGIDVTVNADLEVKTLQVSSVVAVSGDKKVTLPATDVLANSEINIYFDGEVKSTSIVTGNITLYKDGVKQLAAVTYNSAKKAAVLKLKDDVFEAGATYTVSVSGIETETGLSMKAYTTTFTVAVAPIVKSAKYMKTDAGSWATASDIADVDGAVVNGQSAGAVKTEDFMITFNKEMNKSSIENDGNVKVFDKTANKYIAKGSIAANAANSPTAGVAANTSITFTVPGLETGHEYELTVGGMTALDGSAVAPQTFKFFYGIPQLMVSTAAANNQPYTIDNAGVITPLGSSATVYGYQTAYSGYNAFSFKAQFSQDVDAETVNDSNIVLKNKATGDTVATTVTYEAGSRYAIVTPKEDLEEETAYELTVKDIKTAKGLKTLEQKFAFTTGDYAAPTVVSVTPSTGEDNIALNKDIVIKFSEGMDVTSLGTYVKFEDLTLNNGTDILTTYYNPSLSQDGKTYTLNNIKDLTVGHTYQLTIKGDGIRTGVKDDAAGSVNVLRADYVVKFATVNPTTTYLKNVKVTNFDTTGTEVKDGMNSFDAAKQLLYFTFDKKLDNRATSTTWKLESKSHATNVWTEDTTSLATLNFVNNNTTISVGKSSVNWTADTTYRVTISGIKDVNGNDVADQVFTFTVGTKPALNVNGSNPAAFSTTTKTNQQYLYAVIEDAESDLDVSTLTAGNVKFVKKADQSAVPYSFTGAQYRKYTGADAANGQIKTLTHNPVDSSVTVAAASTDIAVSDSTQYQVNETVKVTDGTNTVYAKVTSATSNNIQLDQDTTSVTGTAKIYHVNTYDFGSAAANMSIGKLYAFEDVTGSKGKEYAVVTAKSGNIVTLSNSVTTATTLADSDSINVYEAQGVVYKLDTDAKLESNEQYQLVISGVKDKAGNEIDATTKTFTTAKDVEKLSFVSATVKDGDVSVPVDQKLVLTFNEDVSAEDVALSDNTGNTLTENTDYKVTKSGKEVTITPLGFLKANTVYTISFTSNTASTAGTNITGTKTIQFQTEQNASVKPKIVSAKYVEGDTNSSLVLTFNAPINESVKTALTTSGNVKLDSANITVTSPTLKNDGYTVVLSVANSDLTAAGFTAGASKIAVTSATTDIMGNAFTTDAVVVEK